MRRPGDDGKLHVLEAVLAALLMVGTVLSVSLMEAPAKADNLVYDIHHTRLVDWARALDDLPTKLGGCQGSTLLDQHVLQGISQQHGAWRVAVERAFGAGVAVNLYVGNNGHHYPIHTDFTQPGGTSIRRLFAPNWTRLDATVSTDPLSGTEDLILDVVAAKATRLIKVPGEALETTLTLDGITSDPHYRVSTVTGLPNSAIETDGLTRAFAQTMIWTTDSRPELVRVLWVDDLNPTKPIPEFVVQVSPGLSGPSLDLLRLPQDMTATIRIPSGWSIDEDRMLSRNAQFALTSSGSPDHGWTLEFTLLADSPDPLTIHVFARPPAAPTRPFDDIHAKLGHGSLGESTLLVTYPVGADRELPREVFATTPYPVRHGTRAIFGAAFANGGEEATVRAVDITIPGGYDVNNPHTPGDGYGVRLFNASHPVLVPDANDPSGWSPDPLWSVAPDGRGLHWIGQREVPAGGATSWIVSAMITDDMTQGTNTIPPHGDGVVVTATFPNGYTHTGSRWGPTPGVVRMRVPPESTPGAGDGYPAPAPAPPAPTRDAPFELRAQGYMLDIRNTSTYRVSATPSEGMRTQDALKNSTFHVADRLVPLGGVFEVDANLGSLSAMLSTSGATSTKLDVALYPPGTLGCTPAAVWSRELETLPLAAIRAMTIGDPAGGAATRLFLTGDDARVYALDQAGTTLWSAPLDSEGLAIALAPSPTGGALYVGTERGVLKRFDPTTSAEEWSQRLERAPWSGPTPSGVTALAVDAAGTRVVAATAHGALELFDADGQSIRRVSADDHAPYTQLAFMSDGSILALAPQATHKLHKFDALLAPLATSETQTDVDGFAVGDVGILVAGGAAGARSLVLDPDTLEEDADFAATTHVLGVSRTAAGEATGDAIEDLVFVLSDLSVHVLDGASGSIAWSRVPGDPAPVPAPAKLEAFFPEDGEACNPYDLEGELVTYDAEHVCAPIPTTATPIVHQLVARDGLVALSYVKGNGASWSLLDPTHERWARPVGGDRTPASLAIGAWLTDGGVALGTTDGTLLVRSAQTSTLLLDTEPTEFAGTFKVQGRLPPAGFFGAHVLIATISWTDAQGVAQAARFTEWIEAVLPDGTIPDTRTYDLTWIVLDRSYPITGGP